MAKTRGLKSSAPAMGSRAASMDLSQPASAAPPVSSSPVDSYIVRQYGYKTGENSTQTQANIECWYKNQFVGYINFYPSDSVPESTINLSTTALNAPSGLKLSYPPELRLNYPLERFAEVLQTFRAEQSVSIGVDTIQKVAIVSYGSVPPGHV